MMPYLYYLISLLLLMMPGWTWAEEKQATPPTEISQEDLQVIKIMETLELMEVAERIELLNDMDVLVEPEGQENDED